jgi:DNA processing protein
MTDDDRLARVALACLIEPGSRELGALVDREGAVGALTRLRTKTAGAELVAAAAARLALGDPLALAEIAVRRTERLGGRIVTPDDEEWPAQVDDLRRIPPIGKPHVDRDVFPPLCVWVRGHVPLADAVRHSVAVIGSRASTAYGNHVATEIAYGLATGGWTVVSGGAFGIDAEAHRGALAAGGVTVAVLASGVDRVYPLAHANLYDRITDDGLLVSEWPPGAEPHRHRFLIRNRLIAALTRGTVVVEASARSGAKQTAGRARMLGRPMMAVPGPVTSAMSVGTHQLLRQPEGRLVTSAAEVIEEVGRIGDDLAPLVRGPDRPRDRVGDTYGRVLDGISPRHPAGPQQIAAAAGLPLRVVLQALPLLRDDGFIVEDDSGGWRLTRRPRAT